MVIKVFIYSMLRYSRIWLLGNLAFNFWMKYMSRLTFFLIRSVGHFVNDSKVYESRVYDFCAHFLRASVFLCRPLVVCRRITAWRPSLPALPCLLSHRLFFHRFYFRILCERISLLWCFRVAIPMWRADGQHSERAIFQ